MIKETSQMRLFEVNHQHQEKRDLENMYQTSSEEINWYYPHNMFVTVIQIKDVQSPIPWHPSAGKKMCWTSVKTIFQSDHRKQTRYGGWKSVFQVF